jgi:pyruvoyl-dependent arginine decarboxylase (PvlArgDC)
MVIVGDVDDEMMDAAVLTHACDDDDDHGYYCEHCHQYHDHADHTRYQQTTHAESVCAHSEPQQYHAVAVAAVTMVLHASHQYCYHG